jgi:polar amino acid transport system substrate-binding protein
MKKRSTAVSGYVAKTFWVIKKCAWFVIVSTCFSTWLWSSNVYSENLAAATDVWSPFVIESDDQLTGIGVEILTEVVRRTGDSVTIERVPNKRALVMFDKNQIDMMVIDSPLWNDPEKAHSMVFTDEVMSIQEYIYFRKNHFIDVNTPADLQGKTVDILRGYYYPMFEPAFNQGQVIKNEVDSEASLVKKLVRERTDAIFMDYIAFRYTATELGFEPELFKQGMELSNTSLGIKLRKEKANLLPRFNQAIAEMKQDGTIQKIIDKYIH